MSLNLQPIAVPSQPGRPPSNATALPNEQGQNDLPAFCEVLSRTLTPSAETDEKVATKAPVTTPARRHATLDKTDSAELVATISLALLAPDGKVVKAAVSDPPLDGPESHDTNVANGSRAVATVELVPNSDLLTPMLHERGLRVKPTMPAKASALRPSPSIDPQIAEAGTQVTSSAAAQTGFQPELLRAPTDPGNASQTTPPARPVAASASPALLPASEIIEEQPQVPAPQSAAELWVEHRDGLRGEPAMTTVGVKPPMSPSPNPSLDPQIAVAGPQVNSSAAAQTGFQPELFRAPTDPGNAGQTTLAARPVAASASQALLPVSEIIAEQPQVPAPESALGLLVAQERGLQVRPAMTTRVLNPEQARVSVDQKNGGQANLKAKPNAMIHGTAPATDSGQTAVQATATDAVTVATIQVTATDRSTPATDTFNVNANSLLNPMHAATPGPANAAASSTPDTGSRTSILTPEVGSKEWDKALGQQVLRLGKTGHQVAELQLNPAGLGPLKVTLLMEDHQMQVMFVSDHASVRAAVEAAVPQLRATLADSGISLGNTSVNSGSQAQTAFANSQNNAPNHRNYRYGSTSDAPALSAIPPTGARRHSDGTSVDTYA